MDHERIIGLYERHAAAYDRDRGRSLQERAWLDRFVERLPGRSLLDIGCGMGEPIARRLIDAGLQVTGIDSSPSLIALCRTRFPAHEWVVGDMRSLALGRRFDGLIAWDSLFHLSMDEQRAMFRRFGSHAAPGAPLLFTSGPEAGEALGTWQGEPLYHASLDPSEYEALLAANGFAVEAFTAQDPGCGDHTVWLARAHEV
jgi:2-polyprenyl-3-methyl-5-hydroxy-6-metoxy-1,4-benzoquinol methylase